MTRITGLATGLDVDTLVKQTMQAYQSKIDVQKQKKDILEIKQQLYRDIIKEAQELYNKHFDVLKDGSLIKSSTWQNIKFESSSSVLTVTGNSSSNLGNYTIESGTIAKPASVTKTKDDLKNGITINGIDFPVDITKTNKEIVDNLNNELKKKGINVTVKYTQFTDSKSGEGAFLFESKTLGKSSCFILGEIETIPIEKWENNLTSATITGLTVNDLKNNITDDFKISLKIDNKDITINIANGSENSDIESALNSELKDKGYKANIDSDGNITLTTISTGSGQSKINNIEIQGISKSVNFRDGEGDTLSEKIDITSYIKKCNEKIMINNVVIDLSGKNEEQKLEHLKEVLGDSSFITISNGEIKLDPKAKCYIINTTDDNEIIRGNNANITINNGSGTYTYTGNSNKFTVDDVTFNFTADVPEKGISVTSSQDSSKILEGIKSYIEDYNSLITKINTLISEKKDTNYQPLTDAQKEEMTEKEIELWEAKVKQGQLRNDSDLRRISSALRQGMTNLVSGTGLTLEDIGIESVNDYGGKKDGTFKINEATLKEALENNIEEIANMFTQSTTDTSNNAYNEKGIMLRLKDILYDETVSSKSILAQKVGFEGTVTVANNTLSKQMLQYQKKIDEMNSLFATKEQTLYSQYAKLEVIMNNYNSQMSYLTQSLGLS